MSWRLVKADECVGWGCSGSIISKLYTNSLMASLNSRATIFHSSERLRTQSRSRSGRNMESGSTDGNRSGHGSSGMAAGNSKLTTVEFSTIHEGGREGGKGGQEAEGVAEDMDLGEERAKAPCVCFFLCFLSFNSFHGVGRVLMLGIRILIIRFLLRVSRTIWSMGDRYR